jgi:hypothetical protein
MSSGRVRNAQLGADGDIEWVLQEQRGAIRKHHIGDGNAQISTSTANEAHCEISSIVLGCPEFRFHPLRVGK